MLVPVVAIMTLEKMGKFIIIKLKMNVKAGGYQFVINNPKKIVTQSEKDLINKLLLERISDWGIARVVGVSGAMVAELC